MIEVPHDPVPLKESGEVEFARRKAQTMADLENGVADPMIFNAPTPDSDPKDVSKLRKEFAGTEKFPLTANDNERNK